MMEKEEHLEEAEEEEEEEEEEADEEETSEETDKPEPKQEFILHYERLCRGESNRVCTASSWQWIYTRRINRLRIESNRPSG